MLSDSESQRADNAVLVLGGGIAGIKASLELGEAGRRVYIIDKAPAMGGFLPLLDRQFPTNDCQVCYLRPDTVESARQLDIRVLPLTKLTELSGQAGDFSAKLHTAPRGIDLELCDACGACVDACPEGAILFTPGLDHSSPTCMRYPQQVPTAFSIDWEACTKCGQCIDACGPKAIDLEQQAVDSELLVGSVIAATGAEMFDADSLGEHLGYSVFPDVVTSLEFERIMSAAGPTGGVFRRPSDGRPIKRVGWVQCAGSRTTTKPGNPYCSSICCMFAMKEAYWALEHFEKDLSATIFFMDMRPMGKDYELYYQRLKNELGVNFVRCRPHTVTKNVDTEDLVLSFADENGNATEAPLDLVVLATGLCAPSDAVEQGAALGVELDPYRFLDATDFTPVSTSRPGVYACGMALGPRDIPDSITQAAAAACLAGSHLSAPSGTESEQDLPPERDVSNEPLKVGVFFADWGSRVRGVVDLAKAMEACRFIPDVTHVGELEVAGGDSGLDALVDAIKAEGLNRVVVAGYSPRTHGRLFGDAIRRAGLNRAYVEMANIRDQDAMVHGSDPSAALAKAVDLIRMAVGQVKAAQPIMLHRRPMNTAALVVGGGVAGLSAALALADQGISVTLVERAKELGGNALRVRRALDGSPVETAVADMVQAVMDNDKIRVLSDSLVVDHRGTVGAFKTGVQTGPGMYYQEIEHGVAILATGGRELATTEYLYGKNPAVMTQLELADLLAKGDGSDEKLDSVVMIQCVGSRNDENPTCGRICCRSAVNNALWVKELRPEAQVVVLYRDMRVPYRAEDAYRKAREMGVLFARYSPDDPPKVAVNDGTLQVSFIDKVLGRELLVEPSALVLSTPQVADDEAGEELAELFHLQRGPGGFLLEEHVKIRPVDTPAPGVFAAGSVLAPKSIAEARTQGAAAASRAITLLSRTSLMAAGGVAKVIAERCASCLVCVRACPFGVPFINADGYSEIDPDRCLGCGICAAECPAKAIQLQGFHDDQILGGLEALLEGALS
jgi:heterodisulfide reductase subunit A